MKRYINILVGVDLANKDVLVSDELVPTTEEAISRAVWLAKTNSAKLLFFSALSEWATDFDAETQMLLAEGHGRRTVADHANEVLAKIAESARDQGVTADSRVAFGKSWVELIRQAIRDEHDLVIVGSRHLSPAKSFVLGSTGVKLLRKCPCPVWVTQPRPNSQITTILVAHDLRPVGDLAMELGCSTAQLSEAHLHVLHCAEYAKFGFMRASRVSAENAAKYRQHAESHIQSQLDEFNLTQVPQVHFVTERPDLAIRQHIESHEVDLLVMGTIGRAGIPGLIMGNTAERLLPQITCSVLAVKPDGFKSPVTLDDEDSG